MATEKPQDPKHLSKIWVKKLSGIVNKIKNTKSSMIGIKSKDAIKLAIAELGKSKTIYLKVGVPSEDGLQRHLYPPG